MVSRSVLDIRVDSAKTPEHCGNLSIGPVGRLTGRRRAKVCPFPATILEIHMVDGQFGHDE